MTKKTTKKCASKKAVTKRQHGKKAKHQVSSVQAVISESARQNQGSRERTDSVFQGFFDIFPMAGEGKIISSLPHVSIRQGSQCALRFFTNRIITSQVHYLHDGIESNKGYVSCTGEGCPACAAQEKVQQRAVIPVFHYEHERIELLGIPIPSKSRALDSLFSTIRKILSSENFEQRTIVLKCISNRSYKFTSFTLLDSFYHGDDEIADFKSLMNDGALKISAGMLLSSDEMIRRFPFLKHRMVLTTMMSTNSKMSLTIEDLNSTNEDGPDE
jgi:hypothetical protein